MWAYVDGGELGPSGAADRQQRRDVRRHARAQVIALDAKTGNVIWRYKRELPEDFSALHNTNRGVAL